MFKNAQNKSKKTTTNERVEWQWNTTKKNYIARVKIRDFIMHGKIRKKIKTQPKHDEHNNKS